MEFLSNKPLLITDTILRDAHQSQAATRMTLEQMLPACEILDSIGYYSLECWGGATFDACLRFLDEDPWERLRQLRAHLPHTKLQMLFRGQNILGYKHYADDVVDEFCGKSIDNGIDIIRIFDALNDVRNLEQAIKSTKKYGGQVEATLSYTISPIHNEDYFVKLAKELEQMGADALCIKDMANLLLPMDAYSLVKRLKETVSIPIHLHTHNTTDNQIATYLMAAEAGVDVVDTAIGPLANLTSQPSMNAVVESLRGQERDTGFDPQRLQELADYWADVRLRYESFDKGLKVPVTDIYRYEIPGGQYTNLQPQVESLGLGHRFAEVKEMYRTVNLMLGDIIKVTPSSKMVGDLAIFMVQNDLTPENIVEKGEHLAFPDSVVSYFKGMMGQPPCGFPKDLQRVVLKGEKPITGRPGDLLPPTDWDQLRREIVKFYPNYEEPRSLISYAMYPKVYEEYVRHRKEYGYIMRMGSHVFFNGMAVGEMNKINIEDGKTLMIKYIGLGDRNDDGTRNVQFELNGMRREVAVPDPTAADTAKTVVMADPNDKSQAGASIPGMVSKVNVKPGDQVKVNDVLAVIEAMKMETSVVARMDGTIDEVFVKPSQSVKAGELLLTIK